MGKKPDLIKDTRDFVIHHLDNKGAFAPHTGQDWPAWCSFVYAMQCWTHGGDLSAIGAMNSLLHCAQPTVAILQTFVQAIPAIGDWTHVAQIWPRATNGIVVRGRVEDSFSVAEMGAIERVVKYDDKHKPIGTLAMYRHGWTRVRAIGVQP